MQTLNIVSLRKRLLQDDELVFMVLGQYSRDLPLQLEKLRHAVAVEDMREVARLAHKIKGSSGNVGAELLQEMTSEAEQAALREDRHAVDTLLPAIGSHVLELQKEMETFLLQSPSS